MATPSLNKGFFDDDEGDSIGTRRAVDHCFMDSTQSVPWHVWGRRLFMRSRIINSLFIDQDFSVTVQVNGLLPGSLHP